MDLAYPVNLNFGVVARVKAIGKDTGRSVVHARAVDAGYTVQSLVFFTGPGTFVIHYIDYEYRGDVCAVGCRAC